eukprot:TRINITY_DN331_c0_g1_i2.p1 TRINITY_DN331_c0_g1~~TRINITY_DN331_c0_g1_i2.p1  ORF type:complete len:740 (+),score=141.30 TRINITY_DN331_c0_g1_i2:92-2311(+)
MKSPAITRAKSCNDVHQAEMTSMSHRSYSAIPFPPHPDEVLVDQFGRPFVPVNAADLTSEDASMPISANSETNDDAPLQHHKISIDNRVSTQRDSLDAPPQPLFIVMKNTVKAFVREERATLIVFFIVFLFFLILELTAWSDLSEDAWYSIWSVVIGMCILVRGYAEPDVCLFFTVTLLLLNEIITPKQAFVGFGNDSVVTIGLMLIVVAAVEETGALEYIARFVLRKPTTIEAALLRMMTLVSTASAFMNNTPLVAVMIPVVDSWCKRNGLPPSKFMMPLSYAAIVGGVCTIIGTSTNLIVRGLAQEKYPDISFPFFEVGIIGLPLTIAGIVYVVIFQRWLLPIRQSASSTVSKDPREYTVSVYIKDNADAAGKTVEAGGLRHLPGLFLIEIERKSGEVIPAPSPDTYVYAGDKLSFAGQVESVKYLWKTKGFVPAFGESNMASKKRKPGSTRVLVEVVLAIHAPYVGKTVRASRFRSEYGAAIIAVHRFGERVKSRIGDIVLQGGDTLLLETTGTFLERFRDHHHFALVSEVKDGVHIEPNRPKLITACLFLSGMIVINGAEILELSTSALACIYALMIFQILTTQQLRKAIPGSILLTVAGAFGIATALDKTGVADRLAENIVDGFSPSGRGIGVFFAVYIATVLLTAILSNGAAVALMFPIADEISQQVGYNPKGLLYVIMLAASADFSTPIGYQTNLMVCGPGGYRFLDYTKFGMPYQIVCMIVTVFITYNQWT